MSFSNDTVQAVWEKGSKVAGNDSARFRKDQCGAWIGRHHYGDRNSEYGWEIDHITPQANGGSDKLSNLRPLQWKNNASRQDGRLSCPIKASGVHNAE